MPTDARSTHEDLQVPHTDNDVNEDMPRIGASIEAIGTKIHDVKQTLAGKAATAHTHEISAIQGLQSALDVLSAAVSGLSTPALNDLDDVNVSSATSGMVLLYVADAWQAAKIAAANVTFGVNNSVADELTALGNAIVALTSVVGGKANSADLGALSGKDQIGTGDVKPDEVRAALETEVKTRVTGDEPEFYDPGEDDWKKFSSSAAVPVGAAIPWFSDVAPNSFWVIVKDVAQTFPRASFPKLLNAYAPERTVVLTSGSAVVTGIGSTNGFAAGMPVEGAGIPAGATILSVDGPAQVTLSADATANGTTCRVFPYGNGDGSSTANFPNFAGRYLRAWDPSAAVNPDAAGRFGGNQEDAFQAHWHNYQGDYSPAAGAALNVELQGNEPYSHSFDNKVRDPITDGVNGTPRTSSETRPKTTIVTWIVKVADGVDDPAVIAAAQVVQDLAGVIAKADANEVAVAKILGVGQEWRDMTASRFPGLANVYQNTAGRPIMVNVHTSFTVGELQISADNVNWFVVDRVPAGGELHGSVVVPDQHYYRLTAGSSYTWMELS